MTRPTLATPASADARRHQLGRRAVLGIELGSTRIKAVLIGAGPRTDRDGYARLGEPIRRRVWTYSLDAVWAGLQACYAALVADVQRRLRRRRCTTVRALGVSAMMHGYLAFDAERRAARRRSAPGATRPPARGRRAAPRCSAHNIPHRWSVAHLYQAILDAEPHVADVDHLHDPGRLRALAAHGRAGAGCRRRQPACSRSTPATGDLRRRAARHASTGWPPTPASAPRLADAASRVRLAGEAAGELTA